MPRFHDLLFVALLCCPQDDASQKVRALIEKLRSDDVALRDAAVHELKEMGKAALPQLDAATRDNDPEVRSRAARLVRVIGLLGVLTPNLRSVMPGIEERLADGDERSWTMEFLAAIEEPEGKRRYPSIRAEDLDPMIARALRAAWKPEDRITVCKAVSRYRLPAAAPDLIAMVQRADPLWRMAAEALAEVNSKAAIPALIERLKAERLKDPGPDAVEKGGDPLDHWAIRCLVKLRAREAIPDLVELLKGESTRDIGAVLLGELGAREAIPEIRRMLKDDRYSMAAKALARLGAQEAVPDLVERLENLPPAVSPAARMRLVEALGDLGAREAVPHLVKLLDDPRARVPLLQQAVRTIGRSGAKEAGADLVRLLKRVPNGRVQGSCLLALADLGTPEAGPASLAFIQNSLDDLYDTEGFEALAVLGDPGTVPAVREALREREARGKTLQGRPRGAAGAFFCRMGSRDGIPLLLGDGIVTSLNSLNALRMPDAWNRLRATRSAEVRQGWADELLSQWARDSGLALELPSGFGAPTFRWLRIPAGGSFLDGLERALGIDFEKHGAFEFILERDRIRVLPAREALTFWRAWRAEADKPK